LLTWWKGRLRVEVELFWTIKALNITNIKSLRNLLNGFGMLNFKISRSFRAFLWRACILFKNDWSYLLRRGIVSEKRSFLAWRSLYDSVARTLLCFRVFTSNILLWVSIISFFSSKWVKLATIIRTLHRHNFHLFATFFRTCYINCISAVLSIIRISVKQNGWCSLWYLIWCWMSYRNFNNLGLRIIWIRY